MWDYDHDDMPENLKSFFIYADQVHNYPTRFATEGKLCKNKHFNSITHGLKSFAHEGPQTLNDLKALNLYKEAKTKHYFVKKYKKYILENY